MKKLQVTDQLHVSWMYLLNILYWLTRTATRVEWPDGFTTRCLFSVTCHCRSVQSIKWDKEKGNGSRTAVCLGHTIKTKQIIFSRELGKTYKLLGQAEIVTAAQVNRHENECYTSRNNLHCYLPVCA